MTHKKKKKKKEKVKNFGSPLWRSRDIKKGSF
jgi:hypothetical protein